LSNIQKEKEELEFNIEENKKEYNEKLNEYQEKVKHVKNIRNDLHKEESEFRKFKKLKAKIVDDVDNSLMKKLESLIVFVGNIREAA